MKVTQMACLWVAVLGYASASSVHSRQIMARGATPAYPSHPDTTKYCSWWWDNDGSIACKDMPAAWFINEEQFLRWNPGLGPNCENFLREWSYCVETTGEPPLTTTGEPTATSTTSGGPRPSTTTGIPTPSPTQPGMVDGCNAFLFVEPGTSCSSILSSKRITLDQFATWNPSVGTNCESLWASVYVCVGVFGFEPPPTTSSLAPTATTKPTNGIETPSPIRPGMVDNCDAFAFVEPGQTCDAIARANGITFADLLKWNTEIGENCEALWANAYICVSIIGHAPAPSTTVEPTPANGVETPTPIQDGMAKNCNKFHFVQRGQTCQVIADLNNISLQNFVNWNPAAGRDCTGLWSNTYACVGLI